MYFGADQLAELARGHGEIFGKFANLRECYIVRNYREDAAREYAIHGFSRRLGTLVRCIDRVFEILPPECEDIPVRDEVIDATIDIQAFVFNIFGCCDNLAWMWVHEKAVTRDDGRPLEPKMIGLGEAYQQVRRSFSPVFTNYLDSRRDWFMHIKDFRDALAHRISLYIPPYIVPPTQIDEYRRLEAAANDALRASDFAGYDQLTADQERLGTFRPIMTHSLVPNTATVVFHPQVLADFNTVDEIGRNLLEELER
jgi:hypothetical protein